MVKVDLSGTLLRRLAWVGVLAVGGIGGAALRSAHATSCVGDREVFEARELSLVAGPEDADPPWAERATLSQDTDADELIIAGDGSALTGSRDIRLAVTQ